MGSSRPHVRAELTSGRSLSLTRQVDYLSLLCLACGRVHDRWPFETVTVCILPDHLQSMWTWGDDVSEISKPFRRVMTARRHVFRASRTAGRVGTARCRRSSLLRGHGTRAFAHPTPASLT